MKTDKYHIEIYVSNDLVTDQRMQKIAMVFRDQGWNVNLVGIRSDKSLAFALEDVKVTRSKLWLSGGIGFYLLLNLYFFWRVLLSSCRIVLAVDLDTLPGIRLACWLRNKNMIWDCHEVFTEIAEIQHKPVVKKIWKILERVFCPGIKTSIAVTSGVANYLSSHFNLTPFLIHNYPLSHQYTKEAIHSKKKIILFQGSLNDGRGLDVMILCMHDVPVDFELHIIGLGHNLSFCRELIDREKLNERVKLLGLLPPSQLQQYTGKAFIGVSLMDPRHFNSYISLANKNLDYLMAGVPCISMAFPEYVKINKQWEVAVLLEELSLEAYRQALLGLIHDTKHYESMHQACMEARQVLCWENESKKLIEIIATIH